MKKYFFLVLLISCSLSAQSQVKEWTFDNDLEGWNPFNLFGPPAPWHWSEDGKASSGPNWNDLPAIRSISEGGAAVMDADFYVNSLPMLLNLQSGLISPINAFNFSSYEGKPLYLKFHQFFKRDVAYSRVNLLDWLGEPLASIQVNADLDSGFMMSNMDYQVIDLQEVTGQKAHEIEYIEFMYSGNDYFWIIDDIQLFEEEPTVETFPSYVGDTLTSLGYPWANDHPDSSWAYVPNQIVIQFDEGTPFNELQAIRDTLGAVLIDSCVCNKLQVWEVGDGGIYPNAMFDPTIDINEKVKGVRTRSKVQGVDYNRYNYNELISNITPTPTPLTSKPTGIALASPSATKIAILDTGIAYDHPYLKDYISGSSQAGRIDDSDNCQDEDYIGWNFVDNNNNPYDDHSHGTHVAGIVVENMKENAPGCEFTIIPYKTHDSQGVSTLFNVACGHYQAAKDGAKVINDSWGFYGDNSEIMDLVFAETLDEDIVIVASAGNDKVDLRFEQSYPACHLTPNLISVSAFDADGFIFSVDYPNYSPDFLDIVAQGRVKSTVPGGTMEYKTGTSMAAPAVAAGAVAAWSVNSTSQDVVRCILDNAYSDPTFATYVFDGQVFDWTGNCLDKICQVQPYGPGSYQDLSVTPSLATNEVFIDLFDVQTPEYLGIINQSGQALVQKQMNGIYRPTPLQVNVADWPNGIYFVAVIEKDYIWHAKFVKIE